MEIQKSEITKICIKENQKIKKNLKKLAKWKIEKSKSKIEKSENLNFF